MKTWKRRWFILTDSCLYYFEFTTVSCPSPSPHPSAPPLMGSQGWGPLRSHSPPLRPLYR